MNITIPPQLWRTEAETIEFAQRLSPALGAGDVILLEGEIGAGKSVFARAVIRAICGEHTEVPSPTFTLVQTYDEGETEIWHADLYRITDPDEALELGLSDAFATAICLIEWPSHLGPYRPENALTLHLSAGENGHTAKFQGDAAWSEKIEAATLNER